MHSSEPPNSPETRGPRRGRALLVVLLVSLAAWLVWVALSTLGAVSSARAGLDTMESLESVATEDLDTLVDSVGGESDDVAEEDAQVQLEAAAADFGAAAQSLDSWAMAPVKLLPFVGRQVRSASALANSAETVATEAATAVGELEAVLAGSSANGPSRVSAVQRSSSALAEFREGVEDIDLGPSEKLVGPLADARNRFEQEYAQVTDTLESMATVLDGVESLLEGPSRYLVLGANNSEMRALGGMVLQIGPLDVADGEFASGDFEATQDLVLSESVAPTDPDIETLWGSYQPYREWRNTNLSPRFDETGEATAAMWEALGRGPVDGVIAIDVPAIEALLEVTGPVTLANGEEVSADMIAENLLIDQYTQFDDRDARRERLGSVAAATLEAINQRDVSASELLRVLREMGAGRHVMMWSSDPVQQAAWEELGTDGIPPDDALGLALSNRGGNKLDPYIDMDAGVAVQPDGEANRFTVEARIRNSAPSGLPYYVAGPHPGTDLDTAEYRGIVTLVMPAGAGNVAIEGGVPVALGDDGPTRVAATEVRVRRGEEVTVRISFDLPMSWQQLEVLPSARTPATQWSGVLGTWTDDQPHEVDLSGSS